MTSVSEILQERNARRYRQFALAIAVLLHTLVIGALVYYADPANATTSKEDVANLEQNINRKVVP